MTACAASRLDRHDLEREMDHPRTADRMWNTTTQYKSLPVHVQPTFVPRNDIGDTAILSGLVTLDSLQSCADEMLVAANAYARYGASAAPAL